MSAHTVLAVAADQMGTTEKWFFWVFAVLAVLGGIGMVWARNAVHSALFLVLTMMSLGVFYVLEAGPFIGMVQVIVYTGAIIMLFLFVIMLVGRESSDSLIETLRGQRTAAILVGLGFAGLVCTVLANALDKVHAKGLAQANAEGNVRGIARAILTNYLFAFEVTSALLITAAVGAMVLAHVHRRKQDRPTQVDLMRARFAPGNHPGPKPGPGVYATSDSVATPARLPDGTMAEQSLARILPPRELTAQESAPKGTER